MDMTVADLIKRLQQVKDKSKLVWALNRDDEMRPDIEIVEDDQCIEIYAKE